MRWGGLFALLFLFSVLEGTLIHVFSMNAWEGSFYILPRFVLVILIFISLTIGRRRAFILGMIFGLFFDIQYLDVIGVYAFTLALIPYLTALAYQYFQVNVFLVVLTVFIGVYFQECTSFYLYQLFGLTKDRFDWLTHLPTAAFNAFFAILLYFPMIRFLEKMTRERQDEEGSLG